jgi:metallo-beta-lactamase family protein
MSRPPGQPQGMELQFLGATGTVTGSKYLLRAAARTLLVDCGLFQGYKNLRLRNWQPFPFDPASLDAVLLTHAHIDHSGSVPLLVKRGYRGRIYCTQGTLDLCRILLPDSGWLQEEEAEYANRRGFSRHHPALQLYTREDAERCLDQFVAVDFDRPFTPAPGVEARFARAGHILGAATLAVAAERRRVVFSGDLGRPNDPIMHPPAVIEAADYLVVESTYGDRRHDPEDPTVKLADIINRTTQRHGVVLIPSFAVGRAQSLLYYIHRLKAEGRIPADLPVFLNSPMAQDATVLYRQHRDEHRLDAEQCYAMCHAARIINSVEESKALNNRRGPMVIIAASGMATGGRVVYHLKALAPDPRNTILFSGYQAGGTRGASILQGVPFVKIHGTQVPIKAEVDVLDNLSAHADSAEIIQWLRGFRHPPKETFITHGEPAAADALRLRIEAELGWRCRAPDQLETVTLD